MSGYFSRIARQSGARFSRGIDSNAGESRRTAGSRVDPIDHVETVMVPPSVTRDLSNAGSYTRDAVDQKQTPRLSSGPPTASITKPRSGPARDEPVPSRLDSDETNLIDPEAPRDSLLRAAPAPTSDEQSIETVRPIEPDNATRTADLRGPDAAGSKPGEKKFFERTLDIVEGRAAEPAEVQTILLREVQDWIAAGHSDSSDFLAEGPEWAGHPREDEPAAPGEQRPGVVRIVESKQRRKLSPETLEERSTAINEQNFELSIGSISVVVEGDDKPPAPAAPPASPRSGSSEPTRRTSRLSRHYL